MFMIMLIIKFMIMLIIKFMIMLIIKFMLIVKFMIMIFLLLLMLVDIIIMDLLVDNNQLFITFLFIHFISLTLYILQPFTQQILLLLITILLDLTSQWPYYSMFMIPSPTPTSIVHCLHIFFIIVPFRILFLSTPIVGHMDVRKYMLIYSIQS